MLLFQITLTSLLIALVFCDPKEEKKFVEDTDYVTIVGEQCLRATHVHVSENELYQSWHLNSFIKFSSGSAQNRLIYTWVFGDRCCDSQIEITFYNSLNDNPKHQFNLRWILKQKPKEQSAEFAQERVHKANEDIFEDPLQVIDAINSDEMIMIGLAIVDNYEGGKRSFARIFTERKNLHGDKYVEPLRDVSIAMGGVDGKKAGGTVIFDCPGRCRHIPLKVNMKTKNGSEKLVYVYPKAQINCTFSLMVSAELDGFSFTFSTAQRLNEIELVFYRDRIEAYIIQKGQEDKKLVQTLTEDVPHYFLEKIPDYRRRVPTTTDREAQDRLVRYFWFHFDIDFGEKIDIRVMPGMAHPGIDPGENQKPIATFEFQPTMVNNRKLERVYINSLSPKAFSRPSADFQHRWNEFSKVQPYLVYAIMKDRNYPCNPFKREWEQETDQNRVWSGEETYEGIYGQKLEIRMRMPFVQV